MVFVLLALAKYGLLFSSECQKDDVVEKAVPIMTPAWLEKAFILLFYERKSFSVLFSGSPWLSMCYVYTVLIFTYVSNLLKQKYLWFTEIKKFGHNRAF